MARIQLPCIRIMTIACGTRTRTGREWHRGYASDVTEVGNRFAESRFPIVRDVSFSCVFHRHAIVCVHYVSAEARFLSIVIAILRIVTFREFVIVTMDRMLPRLSFHALALKLSSSSLFANPDRSS